MRKYLKQGQYSLDENDSLGNGSFGKVYRAYDHTNSMWVALKSIDLNCLEKYGDQMKTIICNEITVMRKFTKKMVEKQCPYLVKHYDCFRTDTNVYIVMELCQRGTLQEYLHLNTLNEAAAKVILEHLIQGLEYLDSLNICHRDLKPENVFIAEATVNGESQVIFKIGDFGFAAQKQSFTEVLGTYPFMAPEIFNRESYTSKVDVWSLGCIAYELLFKQLYFTGKNKWDIQKKVKETPFVLSEPKKSKVSKEMESFIALCLTKNKEERPKASDLLKHPLFAGPKKQFTDQVFQIFQCELDYCEFLRSMAEQICEFGSKLKRRTQFIQMYFLKKSFSIVNILTYSIMNRKNYLNMENDAFQWMLEQKNAAKFSELSGKVQKEYILVSTIYNAKYEDFLKYIEKFTTSQQEKIKGVIAHQQIYQDIDASVYKEELKKWSKVLSQHQEYSQLQKKCQKLIEI